MQQLPEMLFAVDAENSSPGYIILNQVYEVPVCGKVVQYPSHIAMLTALEDRPPLAFAVVPGYHIAILYNGILGNGNRLNVTTQTIVKLKGIMERMALFYLEHKCMRHESRFKRYKIV